MTSNATNIATPVEPRSSRVFFIIWIGQAFSLMGSQLVQFGLVWWLTKMTGSATVLAIASMMAVLPQIVISPFAGALVDRWNRRMIMIVSDAMTALGTIILLLLFLSGSVQVWHVYALMLIRATGGVFQLPAMMASTAMLVPEQHLSRIAGLNQALQGLLAIFVPVLGALALDFLSIEAILGIDVLTAIPAILPLLFLTIPQPVPSDASSPAGNKPSTLDDLRAGLRLVWNWKGMLMLMSIAALINMLFGSAYALLPILVTRHFAGSASELAWLQAIGGVGIIIGGILLGAWGGFKRRIITLSLGGLLMGVGVTVLGITPSNLFPVAVAAAFFIGVMNPMLNGSLIAILQATIPKDMQGRVFTLLTSVAMAVSPLGLAIAGPVSDTVGVQKWFLLAGIVQIAMFIGAFFVPAIMQVEDGVTV
jgi:DHA3 family macrolide efflux protein-like MFS transporter